MTKPDEARLTNKDVLTPHFRLPSTEGYDLGPGDFKHRRNLMVVFLHKAECIPCRALLKTLSGQYPRFQALEAEILAIIGGEKKVAKALHSQMQIPFPFLFDAEDRMAALCLGAEGALRPAILVADRYGAL